jgi:uncharacterized protein YggE
MATSSTPNFSEEMNRYILTAIKEHISKVFDKAIEQAVEDAKAKRDEIVAAQALKMTSWMQIQDNSRQIILTLEKPGEPR